MMNKEPLPVIIEDLIAKVIDGKTHYENRQHYANTLERIRKGINEALKIYETHRKS